MTKDTMIGVNLAKNVFQLHGASMTGKPRFCKKLSRQSFSRFMAEQPPAVVLMEACVFRCFAAFTQMANNELLAVGAGIGIARR